MSIQQQLQRLTARYSKLLLAELVDEYCVFKDISKGCLVIDQAIQLKTLTEAESQRARASELMLVY